MNASGLNTLLVSFKALKMGPTFVVKYPGTDAITNMRFSVGSYARVLDSKVLLTTPLFGGVEVLAMAARVPHGKFVDDIEGDGVYYTINCNGGVTEFSVSGLKVHAKSNYGRDCSLAAYKSQKLRHQIALIKVG